VSDVQFEGDSPVSAQRLLPERTASSPVVTALVRARVVPSERAARFAVIAVAVLGVGGAFVSIYFSSPNRGIAGVRYEDLSAAERAQIPAAERAYLEHVNQIRQERERAEPSAQRPK
jgi:hypothetical protein